MLFMRQTKPVHVPWNKGRIIGQEPPWKPKHEQAIRTNLQMAQKWCGRAMFSFLIDSKQRGCDLVR